MSLITLPVELAEIIVDALWLSYVDCPGQKDPFSSLASTWRPALPRIRHHRFSHIILYSASSNVVAKLAAIAPAIHSVVRALEFVDAHAVVGRWTESREAMSHVLTHTELPSTLDQFRNLERLVLFGLLQGSMPTAVMTACSAFPRLTDVELANVEVEELGALDGLIRAFPNVEVLSIYALEVSTLRNGPQDPRIGPDTEAAPTTAALGSFPFVRALKLNPHTPGDDALLDLLASKHNPFTGLRSLTIDSQYHVIPFRTVYDTLRHCTGLTHLVLDRIYHTDEPGTQLKFPRHLKSLQIRIKLTHVDLDDDALMLLKQYARALQMLAAETESSPVPAGLQLSVVMGIGRRWSIDQHDELCDAIADLDTVLAHPSLIGSLQWTIYTRYRDTQKDMEGWLWKKFPKVRREFFEGENKRRGNVKWVS